MTLHTVYLGYYQTNTVHFNTQRVYYELDAVTGKFVRKIDKHISLNRVVVYSKNLTARHFGPFVRSSDIQAFTPRYCRNVFNKYKYDPAFQVWFEYPSYKPWRGFDYMQIKITKHTYTNLILQRLEV